jgi:hypothetical protein
MRTLTSGENRAETMKAPPGSNRMRGLKCRICFCSSSAVSGDFAVPHNLVSLRAFLALDHVKLDLISFFQALVALNLDRRIMHEDIRTIVPADETETLCVVEPLHFAFELCHRQCLPWRGLRMRRASRNPTLFMETR